MKPLKFSYFSLYLSGFLQFFEKFLQKSLEVIKKNTYLCNPKRKEWVTNAEVAQLVEHNLAKVGVASSSLVFRSKKRSQQKC